MNSKDNLEKFKQYVFLDIDKKLKLGYNTNEINLNLKNEELQEIKNEKNVHLNMLNINEQKYKNKSYNKGFILYLECYKEISENDQKKYLYKIHNKKVIKKKMNKTVYEVVNLINIIYEYAYIFLKFYKFNVNHLIEDWYDDYKKVFAKSNFNYLKIEDIYCINDDKINDDNISNDNISNDNISNDSISNNNISNDSISDYNISNDNISNDNISNDNINNDNISNNNISNDNISNDNINNNNINNMNNNLNNFFICPILYIECDLNNTYSLKCGHRYSKICWKKYLKTSLENKFEEDILKLKCIDLKCNEIIRKKDWKILCDKNLYKKYLNIYINLYIKETKNLNKCPNKNCNNVIELSEYSNNNNVICKCGYYFCFSCLLECHRPINCFFAKEWFDLAKKNDLNVNWIKVKTKECPNCHECIEKDSGCMKIICICGYSFCWICIKSWNNHKGGYYKCNEYVDKLNEDKMINEKEENDKIYKTERKKIASELHKYIHFRDRFLAHDYGEKFSTEKQMNYLCNYCIENKINIDRLKIYQNAIIEIIKCRKILKWSYAYAYFNKWNNKATKKLFEYQQGELEKNLENLQEKTENIHLSLFLNKSDNEHVLDIKQLTMNVNKYFNQITNFFEQNFIN